MTAPLSPDDSESLEETLALLSDPGAMAQLAEAEADVRNGNTFALDDVIEELNLRGRFAGHDLMGDLERERAEEREREDRRGR